MDTTFILRKIVSWLQMHHPESLPDDLKPQLETETSKPSDPPVNSSFDETSIEEPIEEPKNSTPSTPPSTSSASQSLSETRKVFTAITSLLTVPAVPPEKLQSKKPPGPSRVLTSEESLAQLQEKEKKKKEEEEAKEMRKKERERKRLEREAEKKRKAEEREQKALERQRKKAELEKQREEKRQQRELKRQEKNKIPGKQFVTRSKGLGGELSSKTSDNICHVCSGTYEDDICSDGTLQREWVQCTDEECSVWSHEDCLTRSEDQFVCSCGNLFC